jgi:hypothetical protein
MRKTQTQLLAADNPLHERFPPERWQIARAHYVMHSAE